MKKKIVIVFLTFNSEKTIRSSILSASRISKNIYVIDSFSNDKTLAICKKLNCKIIKRKFKNYSDQRNWAIKRFNKKYIWQLHLDADENLNFNAVKSIKKIILSKKKIATVFLIKRKSYFLNTLLNYPGINTWHLRLFKSKHATCENKLYDQHFVSQKKLEKINGYMTDNDKLNLNQWKTKHNKWAKFTAKEISKKIKIKNFQKKNDPRYLNRILQKIYYILPLYIRPILYFFYRYIFRFGFLDGKIGFLFCFYHALWFRYRVDKYIDNKKYNQIK